MGRRFRNPWVRRLDPSLIPFPKTGQGYTKFPVNYIFLSVNRFFFNKQVYDETCITAPGIYRHLRYVNELYYSQLCFSISTYFFFLCLFSFVYVVSGNETAAIRSKLLLVMYRNNDFVARAAVIVLWRTSPFLKWSLKFTKCFSSISFSKALFYHIKYNSVSHVILLDTILILAIVLNLVTQEFPVFVDSYLLVKLTFMTKSPRPICQATW